MIQLSDDQLEAISKLSNGRILCGDVGTGKSRTALGYYFICNDGGIKPYHDMKEEPQDLYIITTAKKRDSNEWEEEMAPFLLTKNPECKKYDHVVVVDSWNNIKKYTDVENAFFIFDEQRLTGNGAWVKSFYKIAAKNEWILLTATPGDTWMDYIPVFVANGYYRNRSDFLRQHVIFKPHRDYPIVDRYEGTGRLIAIRRRLLVNIEATKPAVQHHQNIIVDYDILSYKTCFKSLWNPFKNEPIKQAAELCSCLRRIVNSDPSRVKNLLRIVQQHDRVIVFYNFDYELDILKGIYYGKGFEIAEWNGHNHQEIPKSKKWVYLVNYKAGAEGWNCTLTDTMIFYSQNYSYKVMAQSSGRIDRRNTPYKDLYYYHFKSRAPIDLAISRAIHDKKVFNEQAFIRELGSQK